MPATVEKSISVSQLRKQLKEVLEDCFERGQRFQVMTNTDAVAILVSVAEWNKMTETLEILMNRSLIKQIVESEKEIKAGESRPAADVFDEIEKDLEEDDE